VCLTTTAVVDRFRFIERECFYRVCKCVCVCVFVCVVLIHVKLLQSLYLCVTFPTVPALFLEAGGFTQTHTSSKPNLDEKYSFALTQVQIQSPQDQVQLTAHLIFKHIKLMQMSNRFLYKTCLKTSLKQSNFHLR